jgi:hypothetical protein
LVYWFKERIKGRYIVELKIHQLDKSSRYPDGVKYSLICKDLESDRKVLVDNHHPKGHHVHLDEQEQTYLFQGTDKLIDDFKVLVNDHMGVKL